jgi:hypothetical protein
MVNDWKAGKIGLFWTIVILLLVLALTVVIGKEREARISTWASENGYRIISNEYCSFDTGPFFFKGKHDTICKLLLEKDGVRKSAYVKIGLSLEVKFVER